MKSYALHNYCLFMFMKITWLGNRVEIVSLEGRRSVMALDASGYLARVTWSINPGRNDELKPCSGQRRA